VVRAAQLLHLLHRRRRDDARERGASLVEFTLIVPILLMIVFAIFTGGIVYNNKLDIVHSAREGARYGATVPQSQCIPTSNCGGKTWAQMVQSVVADRSDGVISTSQVCVSLVSGSSGTVVGGSSSADFTTKTDGSACFNDGNADSGTRVQVSAQRTGDKINAVLFTIPVTLTSQATARFEQ
jgi:Flp pilus assembly protein TadG